jgi:hypothetical protein
VDAKPSIHDGIPLPFTLYPPLFPNNSPVTVWFTLTVQVCRADKSGPFDHSVDLRPTRATVLFLCSFPFYHDVYVGIIGRYEGSKR